MKKKFIIILILIIVVILSIGGFVVLGDVLDQYKLDYDRINNSKTLSKYIEYHGLQYVGDTYGNTYMFFNSKDIKCDVLKDKNILYYGNDIIVFDDYTVYETAFSSEMTYSNGQQCKPLELDIDIDRILIDYYTLYFITKDNNYYTMELSKKTLIKTEKYSVNKLLFNDKEIVKYVSSDSNSNSTDDLYNYIVLKTDGNLYEYQFTRKYNSSKGEWQYDLTNKQLLSNQDYGYITDFIYSSSYNFNLTHGIELDEQVLMQIISDKGLFYLKQTTDQQYIDTKPTFEMVESEIYNKYKSDVKYINSDYIFTHDNNIINTYMICRDIDKEVK